MASEEYNPLDYVSTTHSLLDAAVEESKSSEILLMDDEDIGTSSDDIVFHRSHGVSDIEDEEVTVCRGNRRWWRREVRGDREEGEGPGRIERIKRKGKESKGSASAGNRTRFACLEGRHHTIRPRMLVVDFI